MADAANTTTRNQLSDTDGMDRGRLTPDTDQINRFLALLGKDPATTRIRAFFPKGDPRRDDGKEPGRKGPLAAGRIQQWQTEGRGIYLVINNGDGEHGADRGADVQSCIALFAEWDDRPVDWQLQAWKELGLPEPTLQVGTGGRSIHSYWVLDQPIPPEQWEPLQARLLDHADADRSIKDPARVMRLPGCWYMHPANQIGEKSRIISASGQRYSAAALEACLPPAPQPRPAAEPSAGSSGASAATAVPLEELLPQAIEQLVSSGAVEGTRNSSAFQLACSATAIEAAAQAAGLRVDGTAADLLQRFASRCTPPLAASEAEETLRSARSQQRTVDPGWTDRLRYQLNRQDCRQQERQQERRTKPKDRAPVDPFKELRRLALELLQSKTPVHERTARIRAAASGFGVSLRDGEIFSLVAEARRKLQGQAAALEPGDEFDVPDDAWAWDQVIAAHTANLIVALQKVGKTALVAGMIGAWHAGASEYLGLPLIGPCPPVLIAGTDQTIGDWFRVLEPAGLMERNPATGKARLTPGGPIKRLWHRGNPVFLDMPGLDVLADACSEFPGALLLCDAYAAMVAPLGLDEAKPEAAEPLYNLMEVIEQHGTTLVLIHHSSKSRANERASSASRNSNAIPAAVSQIISLHWVEPEKKSDQRIQLTTEGRNSKPVDLVIEQVARSQWVSHGSGEIVRQRQRLQKVKKDLTDRQRLVFDEVLKRWRHQLDSTAQNIRNALPQEFDEDRKARRTLEELEKKGLLESRGSSSDLSTRGGGAGGRPANRYRPVEVLCLAGMSKPRPKRPKPPKGDPSPKCEPTIQTTSFTSVGFSHSEVSDISDAVWTSPRGMQATPTPGAPTAAEEVPPGPAASKPLPESSAPAKTTAAVPSDPPPALSPAPATMEPPQPPTPMPMPELTSWFSTLNPWQRRALQLRAEGNKDIPAKLINPLAAELGADQVPVEARQLLQFLQKPEAIAWIASNSTNPEAAA